MVIPRSVVTEKTGLAHKGQQEDVADYLSGSGAKDTITCDFPKPNCLVLQASQLDDLACEQLRKKGKDPQSGYCTRFRCSC